MEVGRQCDLEGGEVSGAKEELEGGALPMEEASEIKLLTIVLDSSSRPNPEISIYDGNLKYGNLLDWINEMDKYFEYEEIDEDKGVKSVVPRLKGCATLWLVNVLAERRKKEKPLIRN